MRTGTIIIGGQEYPVKGLSVRQALAEDTRLAEEKSPVESRMRRVALALQRGGAFLPDPSNPKGQFDCATMKLEDVVKVLDSDIFDSMTEWYEAEQAVLKLNSKPVPEGEKSEVQTAGEPQATE